VKNKNKYFLRKGVVNEEKPKKREGIEHSGKIKAGRFIHARKQSILKVVDFLKDVLNKSS